MQVCAVLCCVVWPARGQSSRRWVVDARDACRWPLVMDHPLLVVPGFMSAACCVLCAAQNVLCAVCYVLCAAVPCSMCYELRAPLAAL